MKATPTTHVVSALTARTQLGQILKRVKKNNERFVVDRRGEPQAVIMSMDDYIKTMAPPPAWLQGIWSASARRQTSRLTMREINAEIATARREVRKKRAG